jgi:hypothetical protein
MPPSPDWLEPIVELKDFDGDPTVYIEHLFSIFTHDFIESTPQFRGNRVFYDNHDDGGKPNAFVHITTEENRETRSRELCLRRCERITWIRAIIENSDDPAVLMWDKEQKTGKGWKMRTYLFLEPEDFLVVLEQKTRGHYMITAIYVDNPNQKRKHLKAYNEYQQRSGA